LSPGGFAGFLQPMSNVRLPLALLASLLITSAPVAAQQSGARAQVTVSAHIISGESLHVATAAKPDSGTQPSHRDKSPLVRTHGEITLAGQPDIMLTEFH